MPPFTPTNTPALALALNLTYTLSPPSLPPHPRQAELYKSQSLNGSRRTPAPHMLAARVPAPSGLGTSAPYIGATIASAAAAAAAAASGETLVQSEGKALQQLDRRLYALTHPSDRSVHRPGSSSLSATGASFSQRPSSRGVDRRPSHSERVAGGSSSYQMHQKILTVQEELAEAAAAAAAAARPATPRSRGGSAQHVGSAQHLGSAQRGRSASTPAGPHRSEAIRGEAIRAMPPPQEWAVGGEQGGRPAAPANPAVVRAGPGPRRPHPTGHAHPGGNVHAGSVARGRSPRELGSGVGVSGSCSSPRCGAPRGGGVVGVGGDARPTMMHRAQQNGAAADASWSSRMLHRAQQENGGAASSAAAAAAAAEIRRQQHRDTAREWEMKDGSDGWRPSSALTALGTTRHERTAAHIAAADSSRRAAAAVALVAAGGGRQPYAMALGKTTIFGPMGMVSPSTHRMRTKSGR